nr:uncharacterized protein LOC127332567 isoform X2 [Lolium perenne]
MDIQALPRRDLQALCKRNGIRANMTNAAMADALAALPAVDGIQDYAKPPVAAQPTPVPKAAVPAVAAEEEEGEMQGISLPGGRGVALTAPEVIVVGDGEEEDEDLMPALGPGRRRASRRPRVEPVAVPATRRRAAASTAETAADAVPGRTTRSRSQRVAVPAPEPRWTPRRTVARKTNTEKEEEEEKGAQGNASDDCAVDSSEQADVQCEASEEIHPASEDAKPVPVISGEAAEQVDFTSGVAEANKVPTSGSAAKATEEKEPVAAPARTTRKRAAANMAEVATEAVPVRTTRARSQRVVVVSAPEEETPKARRMSRRAMARKTSTEQEEEEEGMQGDVSDDCVVDSSVQERHDDVHESRDSPVFQNDTASSEEIHHASEDTEMAAVKDVPLAMLSDEAATSGASEEKEVPTSGEKLESAAKAIEEEPVATPATTTRKRAAASMAKIATEAVPARTTRARSQRVVVSAPEEEAPKARRMSRRAVARKTSTEQEEEEKETQGDISHDCVVVQELQADVQQSQDSPNFRNDTISSEEIHLSCEGTVMVPANEVPLAMLKSGDAAEEVDFTSGANKENEVPTRGEMLQSAANAIEEKEDMAGVEEEAVVATDEMSQRSATVEDRVIEVVTIDNLSQAAVTDDEGAVKESGFSCDITGLSVQEKVVVAANCMPQGLAKLDQSVEQVVTIENLSQATLTDDEGPIKESGFSCNLADVSVEEMSQRSAILDENLSQATVTEDVATIENLSQATVTEDVATIENLSQATVTEDVATIENLSQATVTDDEWVVKENAFASDLPAVFDTARDFSGHIASSLSAGMREIPTKSLSINSITESVAVERVKEVKECEALGSLSLRKLKMKVKEKVSVELEKKDKECKALGSLSLRKLKMELKKKVVVAQKNEVPLFMYSSSGGEKNTSEPMGVEREEEMKVGNESEALACLSQRKLKTKLNEKAAVTQENGVKEGKESKALDGLSLRKLKLKLKKTLNAQKVISESHPSM